MATGTRKRSRLGGGPRKRAAAWLLAAVLAVAAIGCGSDGDEEAAQTQAAPEATTEVAEPGPGTGDRVLINTFIFRPDPITVEAGTTVTWTNDDEILHTVTDGPRGKRTGEFDGQLDGDGSTFEFTYEEPGEYPYFCSIHPGMDGKVIVE